MKNRGMVRRPLALTAATTIALGGLFFATPAYAADDAADEQAPLTTGQDSTKKSEATELSDEPSEEVTDAADAAEVVAFGVNAAGEDVVIIATEGDETIDEDAIKAFTDAANLGDAKVVTTSSPFSAYADGDVVAGQGYIGLDPSDPRAIYACSIGFTGFSPQGDPALITAGHCAYSESGEKIVETTLSIPGEDPAAGGPGFQIPADPTLLGEFGFAQFGGPNGTDGADQDPNSTDIAVIDINEAGDFNLLPEITKWTTASDNLGSLAEDTIPVRSVGAPTYGEVQKSGRTTGLSAGTISAETDILDGWAPVSGKWVRGFSSDVGSDHGDSGGAVFQGNKAVGVISGGNTTITWSTSLVHGLEHTGGYTVALDLDAPKVTAPANGSAIVGSTVTGTAPGAKTVRVSGVGEAFDAKLENGEFSFKAPSKPGDYEYKIVSTNGFSKSETTSYSLTTKFAPTATPVITSPADGSTVTSTVKTVSGTGVAGAELVATIDGTDYTVTVDGGGNWAVRGLELSYGAHSISVVQTANDDTSDAAKAAFEIAPVAPAVTSVTNGSTFAHDNGPSALSGTGIDGATVTVKLSGAEPTAMAAESGSYTAEVVDGAWTVEFDAALQPGSYTVSATQSISDVASAPVSLAFSVLVEPAPAPTTPPAPEPTTPPAPGGGGGAGDGGEDGNLATTGADMIVPLSASAGAVVLLAGGIVLLTLRRRKLIEG